MKAIRVTKKNNTDLTAVGATVDFKFVLCNYGYSSGLMLWVSHSQMGKEGTDSYVMRMEDAIVLRDTLTAAKIDE